MRTALILLVIVLAGLAWLNPDMNAFREYTETHSEQFLLHETGDTTLGRALSGAGSALAGVLVDRITERRNYLVCSTYTIDLDGKDETGNEWRFLGIAGRFFELQKPESLREEEQP